MTNGVQYIRDGMTLSGFASIIAGAWFCPALWCLIGGVGLIAAAVVWKRYEGTIIDRRSE